MAIALVFQLSCGLALALLARDRVRADGPLAAPVFPLLALHVLGVVIPSALYFYAAHPAWSALYVVDPRQVPSIAVLPLVALHAGAILGGYHLGAQRVRADRVRDVVVAALGAGVAAVAAAVAAGRRLTVSAGHAAFHEGRGREILDVELGWAVVVTVVATLGSLVYLVVEVHRDALRIRGR